MDDGPIDLDQMEAEEAAKYHGKDASEMYYPASYDCVLLTAKEQSQLEVHVSPTCRTCSGTNSKFIPRRFQQQLWYCVPCLGKRGVSWRYHEKKIPMEVLTQIVCYFTEYFEVCFFAEVCHDFFSAVNYDLRLENDVMKCKRYWIGREVRLRQLQAIKEEKGFNYIHHALVVQFTERYDLAGLLQEMMEMYNKREKLTDVQRRRRLVVARMIVNCSHYRKSMNLPKVEEAPSSYDGSNDVLLDEKVKKIMVRGPRKNEAKAIEVEYIDLGKIVFVDQATGLVTHFTDKNASSETNSVEKKKCIIC